MQIQFPFKFSEKDKKVQAQSETDRKTERQKDRKTERQKDRKTERQTNRQNDTEKIIPVVLGKLFLTFEIC